MRQFALKRKRRSMRPRRARSLARTLALGVLSILAPTSASASDEARLRQFSFGTPSSVTRAGFTKVTVNVGLDDDTVRSLRGTRFKVGYWLRLGGGTTVPGLGVRQWLKETPGEGFYYPGGVDDPAVWNHFEAEGRFSTTSSTWTFTRGARSPRPSSPGSASSTSTTFPSR